MDKVNVSLKKSRGFIRLKQGAPLDADNLRKAVVKAGFTPTFVEFESTGAIVPKDGGHALKVEGIGQLIPLSGGPELQKAVAEAGETTIRVKVRIPKGSNTGQLLAFSKP